MDGRIAGGIPPRLADLTCRAAPMWHFLSGNLIGFVIRTESPWLYSFGDRQSTASVNFGGKA